MVLWVLFMFQNVSAAEGTKSKVHWCAILFLWPEKNYLAPVVLFNFPLSIYIYIYFQEALPWVKIILLCHSPYSSLDSFCLSVRVKCIVG